MSEGFSQLWPANTHRLRLGEIEIDSRFRSIHRQGAVHELNQRCFDLLQLFLSEPGVVHSREEIFRRVWPGVVVEDANITTSIWVLRKALGEGAKRWIRTVPKQGYVFDPPSPPEPVLPVEAAARPESAAAVAVESALAPPRRLRRPWFVSVAAGALCLLLGFIQAGEERPPSGRIVLVTQPDAALSSEARWPLELMYGWLDWQLRSVSDRVAVGRDGREEGGKEELIVLLSVEMPADSRGDWRVRANFHGAGYESSIVRRTGPDKLVETLGQVSNEVLQRLVPQALDQSAPALKLDPASAAELVRGTAAEQRRRWNDAVASYRKVLRSAPDFGFARLRLAQCLAELGQSSAAKAELAQARSWMDKLPLALQPLLRAQALAIRQEYLAAAAAFGALRKNSAGERTDFRLAEASNLRKAGRSRDAQERLAQLEPRSPAQAMPWLLERAEIQLANRDQALAQASAGSAMEVARNLGWDRERAQAALLLADVLGTSGQPVADGLFDDAAAAFAQAGDRLGVLRTQVYRELRGDSGSLAAGSHLDELLMEARAAGNVAVEIDALRRAGQFHFRHGDAQRARARFEQARAVAAAAGDTYQQRAVEVLLLHLDGYRNELGAMEQRLNALGAEPLQGSLAYWVGMLSLRLQTRRGQYDASLATLQRTEEQLRAAETHSLPRIAAGLACQRGTVYVYQGRLADAHTAFQACQAPELPYFAHYARIGQAVLDMLGGDQDAARRQLQVLRAEVESEPVQPERWMLSTNLAQAYSTVGDQDAARSLLEPLMPAIVHSGYTAVELDARTSLAEIALAGGHLSEAEDQARAAAALLPADDWFANTRLRYVGVVLDYARGRREQAVHALSAVHQEARKRGDVLAELHAHSLADELLAPAICPAERRSALLLQSGMSGASYAWMLPRHLFGNAAVATVRKLVPP